jgi:hypothetical protein
MCENPEIVVQLCATNETRASLLIVVFFDKAKGTDNLRNENMAASSLSYQCLRVTKLNRLSARAMPRRLNGR